MIALNVKFANNARAHAFRVLFHFIFIYFLVSILIDYKPANAMPENGNKAAHREEWFTEQQKKKMSH